MSDFWCSTRCGLVESRSGYRMKPHGDQRCGEGRSKRAEELERGGKGGASEKGGGGREREEMTSQCMEGGRLGWKGTEQEEVS